MPSSLLQPGGGVTYSSTTKCLQLRAMVPTVEESLVSIFTSASFLNSLPFQAHKGRLADAALAPAEVFEGSYIRDAEEHELGLFSTQGHSSENDGLHHAPSDGAHKAALQRDERAKHRRSLLSRSTGMASSSNTAQHAWNGTNGGHPQSSWNFVKRGGPARAAAPEQATPLRKRRVQQNKVQSQDKDPEAYLLAARKLLQTYPMQRASEHVELLYSQCEGLMDSIADLEESLQQPIPRASTSNLADSTNAEDDKAEFEAEIRREELDILAIRELNAELLREAAAKDKASRNIAANGKSDGSSAPRSTASRRPPPQPVKMPSIRDAKLAASNAKVITNSSAGSLAAPTATSAGTSSGGSTGPGGKKLPAIVARRLAEQQQQKSAASTTTSAARNASPSVKASPSRVRTTPQRAPMSKQAPAPPSVQIQSPSISGTPRGGDDKRVEAEDDEDRTVVLSKPNEPVQTPNAHSAQIPPKRELQLRVSSEQMEKILVKITTTLPKETAKNLRKSPEAVLSMLSQLSAGFASETGSTASPSSSVTGITSISGVTSSPSASNPVTIMEYRLLHNYLTLLVSLPIESESESEDTSSSALQLVMRGAPTSSGTPSASSTSHGADSGGTFPALLPMNALKTLLGKQARERGWNDELGHKAIYGLVAKRILKIDRKGREALVCFT